MEIYIVKQGDTLAKISGQSGLSEERIRILNGIDGDRLVVGQALLLLYPTVTYTVKQGDTLERIAQMFNTDVRALWRANYNISGTYEIYEGQSLVIYYGNAQKRTIITNGYAYPGINTSLLEKTLPYLTYISPFTYGFTENGEILELNDETIRSYASRAGTKTLMHLSTLTVEGNFSNILASNVLNNRDVWPTFADNILSILKERNFSGLDIDFEFVFGSEAGLYAEFVGYLTSRLNPYGYKVICALVPKSSDNQQGDFYQGHNYELLGQAANFVFVMTYEWGYTYGPPMAVAPINGVRNVLNYAVSKIPPSKILMGIPNYAYDWALPYEKGVSRALLLGNEEAVNLAFDKGAEIKYDTGAQTPYFEYKEPDGKNHVVWFEDARSINEKLKLITEFNLAGAGYWNMMRPFNANWALLDYYYNIED